MIRFYRLHLCLCHAVDYTNDYILPLDGSYFMARKYNKSKGMGFTPEQFIEYVQALTSKEIEAVATADTIGSEEE